MFNLRQWQTDFVETMKNSTRCAPLHLRGGSISAERRLNIYANNIRHGLTEALKSIYRVTEQLVGREYFTYMADRYGERHPSRSGNLHDFGQAFPQYMRSLEALSGLMYLPYLAQLEWAYHVAFHAADLHVGFNMQQLRTVSASDMDQIQFRLHPSVSLLHSPCRILPLWEAHQTTELEQVLELDHSDEYILVIRRQLAIEFQTLSKAEFTFLSAIQDRMPFNTCCTMTVKAEPDVDLPHLLASHIHNGTIVDFTTAGNKR